MSKIFSPKIITDGLVMCLDPSQNKSYPTTDLPVKGGLVMWMDAADDTTFSYSSGTTVSQWRDKSGFNYHMVPVSAGPTRNAFQNSRKVLAFTTGQDIQNLSIDLRTSPYTIFIVSRYTSPSTGTQRILASNSSYNNWLLGHWASETNKYYANGWVYNTYVALDTNWKLYLGDWGGPSNDLANFYGAGTAIATNSADASAGPWTLGINATSSERSNCEAAEIIVYNRVLSTVERRLVHTYLGQKWGISNTDRSIVDLSGNNTLLFGGGNTSYAPYFDFYNKGALKFDGGNDFAGTASAITYGTNTTWEAWVNRSASVNDYNMFMGAYLPYFGLKADSTIIFSNTINSVQQTLYSTGFASSNDTWYYLSFTTDYNGTNTTAKIYVNGVLNNSATFTGAQTASNEYFGIGDGRGSTSWYPFNGKVSNVKVYNRTLSAAEIAQNYEAMKSKFANTIVQQGLVLNLDASNPYSYAGAGTTWYDVSGNSNNGTLTLGPTYNSDSGGVIVFDGVDDYVVLNGGGAINNWNPDGTNAGTSYRSYTSANIWFKAATVNTSGASKMIFSDNFGVEYGFYQINNTLYGSAMGTSSTTISANVWYNACIVGDVGRPTTGTYSQSGTTTVTITTTYPITFSTGATVFVGFVKAGGPDAVPTNNNYVVTVTGANTFTITSGVSATSNGTIIYTNSTNQSTVTFYLNGSLIGTNTANTSNGGNDAPFNLGRDNGVAGTNWNGSIALFQLYSKALTAAEVLQNYNATKGRFGL